MAVVLAETAQFCYFYLFFSAELGSKCIFSCLTNSESFTQKNLRIAEISTEVTGEATFYVHSVHNKAINGEKSHSYDKHYIVNTVRTARTRSVNRSVRMLS